MGEFGLAPSPLIKKIVDTVIASNITGIMIWSPRFHNSDGGFFICMLKILDQDLTAGPALLQEKCMMKKYY